MGTMKLIEYISKFKGTVTRKGTHRDKNYTRSNTQEPTGHQKGTLDIKNEDVPDNFPGNIGIEEEIYIKPCLHRTDKMLCMVMPGRNVKVEAEKCNRCGSRQES